MLVNPSGRGGIQLTGDENRQGEPSKDALGCPTPLPLISSDLNEFAHERQAGDINTERTREAIPHLQAGGVDVAGATPQPTISA